MKNNNFNIILCVLCAVCVAQQGNAETVFDIMHPFVGAGIGITHNSYEKDIVARYTDASSELSSNFVAGFSYGVNLGLRFLDVAPKYHPGIQLFYEGINGSAKLQYNEFNVSIHTQHNLIGGAFDNYMLISHNKPGLLGQKVDRFLVLGLEAGQIKSRYNVVDYDYTTLRDDGSFYGIKMEYFTENTYGVGLVFGFNFLQTDTKALPYIIELKMGNKITF